MLGFGVGIYWKLTWGIVLPLGLLVIFVYAMVVYQPLVTDNGEFHPIEATSKIISSWSRIKNSEELFIVRSCGMDSFRNCDPPNPYLGFCWSS